MKSNYFGPMIPKNSNKFGKKLHRYDRRLFVGIFDKNALSG